MTTIYLAQGDSVDIPLRLSNGSTGTNLTGSSVTFVMKSKFGTDSHSIQCLQGAASGNDTIPFSNGGITVPFTSEHTAKELLYFGNVIVTMLGKQVTFPSIGYITIKIKEAI